MTTTEHFDKIRDALKQMARDAAVQQKTVHMITDAYNEIDALSDVEANALYLHMKMREQD